MKKTRFNFWRSVSGLCAVQFMLLALYSSSAACSDQDQYDLGITRASLDERNGQHILIVNLSLQPLNTQNFKLRGVRLQVRHVNEIVWQSFVNSDHGLTQLVVDLPRHYEGLCAFVMAVGTVAGEYKDPDLANNYYCF